MDIIFGQKSPCAIVHELHPRCFSLHFFFPPEHCLPPLVFWFTRQALPTSSSFLFFSFDSLGKLVRLSFFFFWFRCDFFYGHDFYFLINLGNWFFMFAYHFFGFYWASFFNKGICVNLYKLIFFIPSFFYSQPNQMKEIKIFFILLLFCPLTIFYFPTFSSLNGP